jgi:hypothetical protein
VLVEGTRRLVEAAASERVGHVVGPWLPDPLVDAPAADADPADRVTLR